MIIYGEVEDRIYKVLVISGKFKIKKPVVKDNCLVIDDKFKKGDIRLLVSRSGVNTEFDAFEYTGDKWTPTDTFYLPIEGYRMRHPLEMKWLFSVYKEDVDYPGLSKNDIKTLTNYKKELRGNCAWKH